MKFLLRNKALQPWLFQGGYLFSTKLCKVLGGAVKDGCVGHREGTEEVPHAFLYMRKCVLVYVCLHDVRFSAGFFFTSSFRYACVCLSM